MGCPAPACHASEAPQNVRTSASSGSFDGPANGNLYIVRYGSGLMPRYTGSVHSRLQQNRVPAMSVRACVVMRRLDEPRSAYDTESLPAISDSGLSKPALQNISTLDTCLRGLSNSLTSDHIPMFRQATNQHIVIALFLKQITHTSSSLLSFGRPRTFK